MKIQGILVGALGLVGASVADILGAPPEVGHLLRGAAAPFVVSGTRRAFQIGGSLRLGGHRLSKTHLGGAAFALGEVAFAAGEPELGSALRAVGLGLGGVGLASAIRREPGAGSR